MQGVRGLVPLAGDEARQFAQGVSNGLFDQHPFGLRRPAQDVVQHVAAVAGMADAEPQAREIVAAQMGDKVAQAVVSAVTAGPLQPHRARRQIQIVMHDQDLRQRNPVEPRQRRDRVAAAVHEGHRLQQPKLPVGQRDPAGLAVKPGIRAEMAAVLAGQFVHQPESGVVAGVGVLRAGIAQPHHQPRRQRPFALPAIERRGVAAERV